MSAAERRNETHKRAPNCRHPRFVFKTKDVCTRTPHGIICFHTVKDFDALIEAFQPLMLVDDQVRVAPDGKYCWILREKEGVPHVYAMKVICEQEIGSLHNFIFLLSSEDGPLLKEDDKFINAHEVIAAGELEVTGAKREFNLQSGTFMEPIFRMSAWQPILGRRIPKTQEMLVAEIKEKEKEVARLAAQVARFLSADQLATFAYMSPPTPVGPLTRTNIVEHVKSVSEALGGRPFIKGAEIMVSENNMGFLHSLLSPDLPEWKRPLHVSTFKNAKQSYAKHATHATQAKQSYVKHATQAKHAKHAKNPYAKKGGTRRTRKARRARRV